MTRPEPTCDDCEHHAHRPGACQDGPDEYKCGCQDDDTLCIACGHARYLHDDGSLACVGPECGCAAFAAQVSA